MTVTADLPTECDQIMTDVDSHETGTTDSLSTMTTSTLSYCPLSEDSYSDRNTTSGFQTSGYNFIRSPDLLTKNLLITPRNRLSYQGDLRNKSLPNDRRSFQEIKFKNEQDPFQNESFSNKIENKEKSDISILTESVSCSSKEESSHEILMGNNYERLSRKNSIFHQDNSSDEEIMTPCKCSNDSNENLNFKSEESVENIHYETLVVSSPESYNSSQHEMSVSPKVFKLSNNIM